MPSYQWFHLEFLHSNPIGDYRFVFEDTSKLLFVLSSRRFNNQEKSIAKNIPKRKRNRRRWFARYVVILRSSWCVFTECTERYSTVNRLYYYGASSTSHVIIYICAFEICWVFLRWKSYGDIYDKLMDCTRHKYLNASHTVYVFIYLDSQNCIIVYGF